MAAPLDCLDEGAGVTDRQERIDGFDQDTLREATVLLVGAGAVGGEIAEGLVRKGAGTLVLCDEDVVDITNLNRQKFYETDLHENKAVALAANLVNEGTTGTDLVAYPHHFQDVVAFGVAFDPDIVVCAPDNDEARLAVTSHFQDTAPVVVTGLDMEANGGYVFVQEPTGPCFRCFRPDAGGHGGCPGSPAVTDLTKMVAGLALFALDSTLMARYRTWDVYEVGLSGVGVPPPRTVGQRPECSHCGGGT